MEYEANSVKHKIEFDKSFLETFDSMINVYNLAVKKLNDAANGKDVNVEYGLCNCCYKMRYITPGNISTYIGNLSKAIESNMFNEQYGDIEIFSVASVKRFINENNGIPFEESSIMKEDHSFINPKNMTLQDLLLIAQNDVCDVSVYSRSELMSRIKLSQEDIDKVNKAYFSVNMKKIVNALPDILSKSTDMGPFRREALVKSIEEFILFVCSINTISVLSMVAYLVPSASYDTKEKSSGIVTECCMLKTNEMNISNKIPFNINMRDVVLQDMTENFVDIKNAIKFILSDTRSPICLLVNQHGSIKASAIDDYGIITTLFGGLSSCKYGDETYTTKLGHHQIDMNCRCSFETHVEWLDNITFGNNYLDGNYRRDAMGNNKSHPILNTLDAVYKMFGGIDLSTNEDLSNNIIRVGATMVSICNAYSNQTIPNWSLVKDILVVLGEIFTRNMLRLYYNNNHICSYTDDMDDTIAPGFICQESFYMEADGETPTVGVTTNTTNTNTTSNNGTQTGKTKVTVTNGKTNENVKLNFKNVILKIVQRFTSWVTNVLSKFSQKFNENHKKEREFINNNKALNEEIQNAIATGEFVPNVSNFPRYKIPFKEYNSDRFSDEFKTALENEQNNSGEFDKKAFIKKVLKIGENAELNSAIDQAADDKKLKEIFCTYILFSKTQVPAPYSGPLQATGDGDTISWTGIIDDLEKSFPLVEQMCKHGANEMNLTRNTLETEAKKEVKEDDKAGLARKKRAEELASTLSSLSDIYAATPLNIINNKFYKVTYNVYRDVVLAYKQYRGKNPNNQNNPQSTNEQPPAQEQSAEQPATPAADQPAATPTSDNIE